MRKIHKITVAWFLAVLLISLAPLRTKIFLGTTGIMHDAGHLCVFSVSGVMVLAGAATVLGRVGRIVLVSLFCVSLEGLESAIYHNNFEWKDLLLDCFALSVISPCLLYLGRLLLRKYSTRGILPSLA